MGFYCGIDLHSTNSYVTVLDESDVPPGVLYFGQLRGRTLPVAAARFANQMLETFVERFDCG